MLLKGIVRVFDMNLYGIPVSSIVHQHLLTPDSVLCAEFLPGFGADESSPASCLGS